MNEPLTIWRTRSKVPFDKRAREEALAVTRGAHGARAEAFRLVRTNLQFAQVDRDLRIILVTSSLAGEGKTNTAANLALSLAEAGRRTCLVDADLRSPSVARTFGLVQDAGLTSVLIGPKRRTATINGETYTEGDSVQGTTAAHTFTVRRISRYDVSLERAGRTFQLDLTPTALASGDVIQKTGKQMDE